VSGAAGWREIIAGEVAAKAETTQRKSRSHSGKQRLVRFSAFSIPCYDLLVQASNARGISVGGYVRRAVMVQVARDLHLDQLRLFDMDKLIDSGRQGAQRYVKDLDGSVWGRWG
jgi:hypothetical protein